MRILFVTPYIPSRMRVRPYAFIRELAKRGHQITLVCLVQPAEEIEYLPDVAPFCNGIHTVELNRPKSFINTLVSIPTKTPLSVAYCQSDNLQKVTSQLADSRTYDLIHTEFIRAAPATANLSGIPKVFDAVDCLGLAYRRSLGAAYLPPFHRLVSLIEAVKMPGYEKRLLEKFQQTIVSSPVDKYHLTLNGPSDHVIVLSNGVDQDYFSYFDGAREPGTIVFLGKMSYYVNVASVLWFYHKVMPRVWEGAPETRLIIVGRDPDPRILKLRQNTRIVVTGTVPDVRDYLNKAMVAICPMVSGSGIQNKLLEAMAVGTPSVVTELAAQAFEIDPNSITIIARNPEEFAKCVLKLLKDTAIWGKISLNGRHYIEIHHDWSAIGEQLEGIHCRAIQTFIG